MKDKKVVTLINPVPGQNAIPQDFYKNHLAQKLRWYDPILDLCHRIASTIKVAYKRFMTFLIGLLILSGILLGVFGVRAYLGKTTPFTQIEMMGLEASNQELAGTLAGLQDLITSTNMELKDLRKEVAKKQDKK